MDNKILSSNTEEAIVSFKDWLKANRAHLPVNATTWKIQLIETGAIPETHFVALGKYNASKTYSVPFYKPFSKIIKF